MKLLNKIFGGTKLTWLRLIIFSVVLGVLVGIIMLIPAFKGNAIQDIGIGYGWWIIFAIFVVSNCSSTKEAGFKCFIFFLISQPVIYLVQQPFSEKNLLAAYYMPWFIKTIFTLPGGMIAYQIKRNDVIGTLILAVAGVALGIMGGVTIAGGNGGSGISYVILGLFYVASAICLAFVFCPTKKLKLLYLIPVLLAAIGSFAIFTYSKAGGRTVVSLESGHVWELEKAAENNTTGNMVDEITFEIEYTSRNSSAEYILINEDGEEITVSFSIENGRPIVETGNISE